jgi:hypothetical protein
MFPFYSFNVLGVASEVQTGVYKQRPTVVSPAWTVSTSLKPLTISQAHGCRTDSAGNRTRLGVQRTTGERGVGCFED